MMKTLHALFFKLFFVIFFTPLHAQENCFRVLGVWGSPSLNEGSLLPGTLLNTNQQVILPENATLILECLKGKGVVQIYTPGTYPINELSGQVQGVLQANREPFANIQIGVGKHPNIFAQERCICSYGELRLLADIFEINIAPEIYLEWISYKNFEYYEVLITDLADQVIMQIKTKETKMSVKWADILASELDPEFSSAITVHIKGIASNGSEFSNSAAFAVFDANIPEDQVVKNQYDAFKNNYKSLNASTSIDKLNEALFFESISSYVNAMHCYQEAIAAAQTPAMYQTIYQAFLKRIFWQLYK